MIKINENSKLIEKKVKLLKEIEEIDKKIAENISKRLYELKPKPSPKSSKTDSGKTLNRSKSYRRGGRKK